jgi:hypothetical protein
VFAGLHPDEHRIAEGTGEDVPRFGFGRFPCGDQTQTLPLAHHRMVPRENRRAAVPNRVAARIADMRNHGSVKPQGTCYQRRRHCQATRFAGQPGLENLLIGCLDQARQ